MRTTFIYTLSDPRTGEVRYVGKTVHPKRRLYCHLKMQHLGGNGKTHSARWIRSLLADGVEPVMDVIEEVASEDHSDWIDAEQFWVKYLRFLGCRLTNVTLGGEGLFGHRHSEESKMLMAARRRGTRASQETKKKLSEIRMGRKYSKEHVEKVAAWHRGKKRSEEAKSRMKLAQAGRKPSINAIESSRRACVGKKHSEDHINKCRMALTGKKRTQESVERIRESQIKLVREGRSGIVKACAAARLATLGKKQSPEQIAKRVEATRKTNAMKINLAKNLES